MCKQIKKLTELSQCYHLSKTARDAITWAIALIQPPEVEPDKGFDGFDFSLWPAIPDKKIFKELIKSRKAKRGVIMTQAYIDSAARHMHILKDLDITPDQALTVSAMYGWTGFDSEYIVKYFEKTSTSIDKDKQKTEQDYIREIMAGKVTHISQIKGYKNIMTSNYAKGLYKPETMEALTRIGFAV